MRLVLDTNLLVSALLKPGSVPDRALSRIWAGGATVVYDARLTDEYAAVLARPRLALAAADVAALLARVVARGERIDAAPAWLGPLRDEDDRIFVEAALAGRADALVTGNLKDFPTDLGFDVLPPATLLARLGA
jgi:uncharacterized protein